MKVISEIRNLARARNAEHYWLQEAVLRAVTAEFATKHGISVPFEAYRKAFESEDAIYMQTREFADTKSLAEKDAERDKLFRFVRLTVQSKKLSLVAADVTAAEKIEYILKPYGLMSTKPDAENTAMVSDFVKKLQSDDYSKYVDALGLTSAVEVLKTVNDTFSSLYSSRADEKRVRTVTESLREVRRKVDIALAELREAINAIYIVNALVEKSEEKEAEIGAVVDAVNADVLQFAELLSRRGIGRKIAVSTDDEPVTDESDESQSPESSSEDEIPELM